MPRIDRNLAGLGLFFAVAGGGAVLFFWIMAALNLHRGFGLIAELQLYGAWEALFWAYPFVLVAAAVAGVIAFLANANEIAVAVSGLPLAAVVLYYLALVTIY